MALLEHDLWPAVDDVDCGVVPEAHDVAPRTARIAACFFELDKVNEDLESKLRDDFNSILNSMDNLSLHPTTHPPSPPLNPSVSSIHNSSFTITAYSWLLENIANPYPSSTVKASLAERHNCLLSSVNTWFVNARRRMGWTALCRDYFHNCRTDTLDAAYRAFINEDPNRPLRPDVIHAFVSIKAMAERLYSSMFTKSSLVDFHAAVSDMVDQETVLVGEHRHHEPNESVEFSDALEGELQNNKLVAQPCYVSPDSSSSSLPMPPLVKSLMDDSDEEEDVSPPVLAGRKRCLSHSEPHAPNLSSTKRFKTMCNTSCLSASKESIEAPPHNQSPPSTQVPHNSTHPVSCLPDAYANGELVYLQELTVEPPLHAVSDPLLLSMEDSERSIDEWFHSNFNDPFALPPLVDVIAPDLSAQCAVEIFSDYNIPVGKPDKQLSGPLDSSAGDQALTSMDPLELQNLFQSLESGIFVTPLQEVAATMVSPTNSSVLQELLPESIDWAALLDWQTSNPCESILDQSLTDLLPLPEIDLSILQLPLAHPSLSNLHSTGDLQP